MRGKYRGRKEWLQELLEHEEIVRRKGTQLFWLYMKVRDRGKAARIVADALRGKITYEEAMRRLKALAEAR